MTRLRFGIMCEGLRFPAWQAACIRTLIESGLAEPALLVVDGGPPTCWSRLCKLLHRPGRLLFDLYNHLLVRPLVRPFRRQDLSVQLGHLSAITCRVTLNGRDQRFEADDLREIRRHDLDFILGFAFGIVRGEILQVARYGIWSYQHGDEAAFRGGPAGFWELFHDRADTGVILRRLSERLDRGPVLCRGNFRTAVTYAGSLSRIYAQSTEWPTLCARRITAGDTAFLTTAPEPSSAPILEPPTNRQLARFAHRQARRVLRRLTHALLFADDWNIGFAVWRRRDLLSDLTTADVAWAMPSPHGVSLADPMILEEPGSTRVFAEEFDDRRPGRIVSMAWPREFTTATARLELDPGSHVSYPFVFAHEGAVFMAPETCALGRLSLLRRSADGTWRELCCIADGVRLANPTLIRHDGRWWLFCCDGCGVPDTRLMVYHAPRLEGTWQPHLLNPVKFDVRSARPAGPLFTVDDVLYRPAQDRSRRHGSAITINRIARLTPEEFAESPIARLEPAASSPYPDGIHTLVVGDGKILVDGKRARLRLGLLPQQLRRIRARRALADAEPGERRPRIGEVELQPLGPAQQ